MKMSWSVRLKLLVCSMMLLIASPVAAKPDPAMLSVDSLTEVSRMGIAALKQAQGTRSQPSQSDYEYMWAVMHRELRARYPDRVAERPSWVINVAGGALVQIAILSCTRREYLLFINTPVGTEGHTGRYDSTLWDWVLDGEVINFDPGAFAEGSFTQGEHTLMRPRDGSGFRIPDRMSAMEYMRGRISSAFGFGIYKSTLNVTQDWPSAKVQVRECMRLRRGKTKPPRRTRFGRPYTRPMKTAHDLGLAPHPNGASANIETPRLEHARRQNTPPAKHRSRTAGGRACHRGSRCADASR